MLYSIIESLFLCRWNEPSAPSTACSEQSRPPQSLAGLRYPSPTTTQLATEYSVRTTPQVELPRGPELLWAHFFACGPTSVRGSVLAVKQPQNKAEASKQKPIHNVITARIRPKTPRKPAVCLLCASASLFRGSLPHGELTPIIYIYIYVCTEYVCT